MQLVEHGDHIARPVCCAVEVEREGRGQVAVILVVWHGDVASCIRAQWYPLMQRV